jgi:hypothetical protein
VRVNRLAGWYSVCAALASVALGLAQIDLFICKEKAMARGTIPLYIPCFVLMQLCIVDYDRIQAH